MAMNISAWSTESKYLTLPDGFTLERADESEFIVHLTIYMNEDLYFWYSWDSFMSGMKAEMGGNPNLFWIKEGNERIGGVVVQPNLIVYPFLEPPFTDFYRVMNALVKALIAWSDPAKRIWACGILSAQADDLARLGLRLHDSFRCMIRPTETFDVRWEEGFTLRSPERADQKQIAGLFHAAFANGLERDKQSLEECHESLDFFYCKADEISYQASTLVFAEGSGQLIAACLVSPYYNWPLLRTVATLPEYQGRGLATNLIKQALTVLKPHYPAVRLFVSTGNASESVYYKLKFLPGELEQRLYIPPRKSL